MWICCWFVVWVGWCEEVGISFAIKAEYGAAGEGESIACERLGDWQVQDRSKGTREGELETGFGAGKGEPKVGKGVGKGKPKAIKGARKGQIKASNKEAGQNKSKARKRTRDDNNKQEGESPDVPLLEEKNQFPEATHVI